MSGCELSFEDKLSRLEEISVLMQEKSINMQDSLSLYEEGSLLIKELSVEIEQAKAKVKNIMEKE